MVLPTITTTVKVLDEDRTKAIENADLEATDTDRDRGEEEREMSIRVGELGEILAEQAIEQTDDLTLEESSDHRWDGVLNGTKVEIKTRKTWNYPNPDLLVRKNFDFAADFYIQIDLYTERDEAVEKDLSNVTHGEIAGFVEDEEVEKYGEPFMENKSNKDNPTVLVDRNRLRPLHELHALIG